MLQRRIRRISSQKLRKIITKLEETLMKSPENMEDSDFKKYLVGEVSRNPTLSDERKRVGERRRKWRLERYGEDKWI